MDIYSRKFAVIVIIILVGILALQAVTNSGNTRQTIDSETCELYIFDPKTNGKEYLNEFDLTCLDLKNLNK